MRKTGFLSEYNAQNMFQITRLESKTPILWRESHFNQACSTEHSHPLFICNESPLNDLNNIQKIFAQFLGSSCIEAKGNTGQSEKNYAYLKRKED